MSLWPLFVFTFGRYSADGFEKGKPSLRSPLLGVLENFIRVKNTHIHKVCTRQRLPAQSRDKFNRNEDILCICLLYSHKSCTHTHEHTNTRTRHTRWSLAKSQKRLQSSNQTQWIALMFLQIYKVHKIRMQHRLLYLSDHMKYGVPINL